MSHNNYIDKILLLNKNLNNYTKDSFIKISEYLADDNSKSFIFKFLADSNNAIDWFPDLLDKNMFSASEAYKIKQHSGDIPFYKWSTLSYLEKVSTLNKETKDENISWELLTIINNVQDYYFKQKLTIDNSLTWVYFLRTLKNISTQTILDFAEQQSIDIADQWFNSWTKKEGVHGVIFMELANKILPHFLNGDKRGYVTAEKILNIVTQVRDIGKEKKRPMVVSQDYWLTTTFRDHLDTIVKNCNINVIFRLSDKLSILAKEHKESTFSDRNSSSWLPQIDKQPKYATHNKPYEFLAILLKNFVIRTCELDKEKGNEVISKFISQDYQSPFLRRIALFIISRNWNNYQDSLGEFLNIVDDPFENPSYEEELDYLFRHQTKIILESSYLPEIKKRLSESFKKVEQSNKEYWPYFQQKWSEPFKDTEDAFFTEIYQKSCALTQQEKITPIAEIRTIPTVQHSWHQSKDVWLAKDILDKPIDSFILHIKSFLQPQKSTLKWMEMKEQADQLRIAIAENPDYFIHDLSKFLLLDTELPGYILWGYRDAVNQNKLFEWEEILAFCESYLKELNKKEFNKEIHGSFFDFFAGLIEDAAKSDHIEVKLHTSIQKLLNASFKSYPYEAPSEDGDHLTTTINTVYGRLCIAMFSFALHCARKLNENKNSERISWFKDEYNNLLAKGVLEAYLVFGRYLANFCYINQEWAHSKISEFEALDDHRWQWWMEGYLKGAHVYNDLYKLSRSHYQRGIDTQWKDKETKDRLTEHLGVGYLRLNESLTAKDSLFKSLLDSYDFDVYQEIIAFFWSHHEIVEKSYREKKTNKDIERVKKYICAFSQWVTDKEKIDIEKSFGKNYQILLSDLSRLVLFVDKLDDSNMHWVLKSASYVHENHHGHFFWEYLLHLTEDENNLNNLGEVVEQSLQKVGYLIPDDEEKLEALVKALQKEKQMDKANQICNTLALRGYEKLALKLYKNRINKKPTD